MKKYMLGTVGLASLLAMTFSPAASAVAESKSYVAVGGDAAVVDLGGGLPGIGGASFEISPGTTSLHVDIEDETSAGPLFQITYSKDGEDLFFSHYCGDTTIPADEFGVGADNVIIAVSSVPADCEKFEPAPGAPATAGTITITENPTIN